MVSLQSSSPSQSVKVSDFSPAVISRGLGGGKFISQLDSFSSILFKFLCRYTLFLSIFFSFKFNVRYGVKRYSKTLKALVRSINDFVCRLFVKYYLKIAPMRLVGILKRRGNMKVVGLLFGATAMFLLGACATPTVVQAVKPGDNGLSCSQLQNEFADAEKFRADADKEKSVTGGNVVRALFFWPAILGTAANANEAIAAADTRKVHLANQMSQKGCAIPAGGQAGMLSSDTKAPTATISQTKEEQLGELKKLFESNLITKDAYADRQKTILEAPVQR